MRALTALLLSALLHAACLAVLPPPQTSAVPAAPGASLRVAWVDPDEPTRDVPPEPEPEAPTSAPARKPPAPRPAVVVSSPSRSPPGPAGVPGPVPPGAIPPPVPRDAPVAARLLPSLAPGGSVAVAGPPTDGGTPRTGAQALVEDLVNEAVGHGKVDRGLVHPYFGDLGKALVATWTPERTVTDKGLRGFLQQFGRNVQTFAGLLQQQAEAYGRSGAPWGREDHLEPDSIPLLGRSELQEVAAQQRLRKQLREKSRELRRAQVRVVQDRQGRLLSVELLRRSPFPDLDRSALEDVRAAASALPVPPPEALGDRQTLVSLWDFELVVSITPPVPMVTFEFDLVLRYADARLPLDRRIYKRVRLVAVE